MIKVDAKHEIMMEKSNNKHQLVIKNGKLCKGSLRSESSKNYVPNTNKPPNNKRTSPKRSKRR